MMTSAYFGMLTRDRSDAMQQAKMGQKLARVARGLEHDVSSADSL